MSDTLNALLTANRSSTVLQGIANPPVVNPLAALGGAAQTAGTIYNLRRLQAEQLQGEAAVGAINPDTGQMDPAAYGRALQGSGPAAAMGAQDSMQKAQTLSTNQLGFNDAQQAQIGRVFGSMINQPDGAQSPAAYKAALLQLHANGTLDSSHLAAAFSAVDALGPNPDPTAMRQSATRMLMTALSTADIARTALPRVELQTGAQGTVPYLVQPAPAGATPGGGMQQQPGGFVQGLPPQPGQVPDTRPGAPPGTTTPVIPPGGGGTQPQPPVPSKIPGGGVYRPPAPAPASPPAATPAPTAPGTPPAAPSDAPAPTATATPQPTYTAPPAGQADVLQKDINARTGALTAMPDQQKRLIAGQSALQALDLAQNTGPGTAAMAKAYAFLQAQAPGSAPPQGNMSATDYRQILVKNLLRFAQNNGQAAGTDLGLHTKLESNANADEMLPEANRHVLLQDLGILKRDMAQTNEMPAASGTGDVVKHIGSFPANTAPEAFMWNAYSPAERDAIEAQYAKDGQTQKLHDSLALAVKRGAIPDPRKAPPAVATPPVVTPPVVVAPQPTPRPTVRPPGAQSLATPNLLSAYA